METNIAELFRLTGGNVEHTQTFVKMLLLMVVMVMGVCVFLCLRVCVFNSLCLF